MGGGDEVEKMGRRSQKNNYYSRFWPAFSAATPLLTRAGEKIDRAHPTQGMRLASLRNSPGPPFRF